MHRHPKSGGVDRDDHRADVLVELMANQRNRHIIRYLRTHGPSQVELSTLVQAVQQAESATHTENSDERRTRVTIDLHHCRLPQLADVGLIDYDPDSRTITYPAE